MVEPRKEDAHVDLSSEDLGEIAAQLKARFARTRRDPVSLLDSIRASWS
jgi:hypothetical protein